MYLKVFGKIKTILGDTNKAYSGDYKHTSPFVLASTATNIDGLYFRARIINATVNLKGLIYSDNAGDPDALLYTTNEVTGVINGWHYLPFSSRISSLSAGTYHLGIIADGSITTWADFLTDSQESNADTYSDGPSDPFGTVTNSYYQVPIGAVEDVSSLNVFKMNNYAVLENIGLTVYKLNYYAVLNIPRNKQSNVMILT